MSFLDDIKIYGLVAIIIGLVGVVLTLVGVFEQDSIEIGGIAGAVPGLMLLIIGYLAYTGRTRGKVEATTYFILFVGLGILISGILVVDIISIVIGVIAVLLGYILYTGNKLSRLWWYILMIVFILLAIWYLLIAIGNFTDGGLGSILSGIVWLLYVIMYVFVIHFMLSSEVGSVFGKK